jgi:SNF family Na+-dependent transporter
MSDGIENPIGMNWKLVACLFVSWMLAFLSLYKGIQSLGKVSYVTAIFPYIMIFALIIRGVTLPGSMKGIIYYIGSIDMSKLMTLKVN